MDDQQQRAIISQNEMLRQQIATARQLFRAILMAHVDPDTPTESDAEYMALSETVNIMKQMANRGVNATLLNERQRTIIGKDGGAHTVTVYPLAGAFSYRAQNIDGDVFLTGHGFDGEDAAFAAAEVTLNQSLDRRHAGHEIRQKGYGTEAMNWCENCDEEVTS